MNDQVFYPKPTERYKPTRDTTVTIGPKCNGNSGLWRCMTHNRTFESQAEMEDHTITGHHKMAFICHEHGYETPEI